MAPDLRGFGWSKAPPGDYFKRTWAEDVIELLDAESLEHVPIIGHDWGGYVRFLLALEHPERVERLLALDITPPWPEPPRLRHLALPLLVSYQVLLAMPGLGSRLLQRGPRSSGPSSAPAAVRAGAGPGRNSMSTPTSCAFPLAQPRARPATGRS